MELRNGRFWSHARRAVPFVLTGTLALGALGAHAARHWLYVPFSSSAPAPGMRSADANPLSIFALPASEQMRFEGRVVTRLEAGSYVYLELERASGERAWVVTLGSSEGARRDVRAAHVVAVGYAPHFESKRLRRSFDGLYFAVVRPS